MLFDKARGPVKSVHLCIAADPLGKFDTLGTIGGSRDFQIGCWTLCRYLILHHVDTLRAPCVPVWELAEGDEA